MKLSKLLIFGLVFMFLISFSSVFGSLDYTTGVVTTSGMPGYNIPVGQYLEDNVNDGCFVNNGICAYLTISADVNDYLLITFNDSYDINRIGFFNLSDGSSGTYGFDFEILIDSISIYNGSYDGLTPISLNTPITPTTGSTLKFLITGMDTTTHLVNLIELFAYFEIGNFTITAKDSYTDNSINDFSVEIQSNEFPLTKTYSTTNGTIETEIPNNSTSLYNITFFNMSNYLNRTYTNYNISASGNLQGELFPYFSFKNITYSNFINYNSTNYTRNLSVTTNMFSFTEFNPILKIYENGTLKETKNITGNGSISFTTYYKSTTEGNKNLTFEIYNDYGNITESQNFTFDLNNPTTNLYFNVATGFTIAVNVSAICTDTVFPNLRYNLSLNNNILFLGNRTSGYNQTNETTLETGTNTGKIMCYDPFGNTTETKEVQAYAKTLILINELNGSLFNVNNVTGVKVYYSNSSFFDFKTMNLSQVNFTSTDDSKLRFEIEYEDGTIITRYIDNLLINSTDLRVCANPTGTTHYENLIGSSSPKKVLLLNLFSQCYVGADETSFAYQDGLVLKVFTIASKYNLYYYDPTDTLKLLALLDGSISIFHNIDVLEFKQKGYEFSIISDGLTFEKYKVNGTIVDDIMLVRYDNIKDNVAIANLVITNLDDNTEVYNINLTDPNNQLILWNYSGINITNTTLFKLEIFKTLTSGIEETTTRYFNTKINTGILKNELVYVLTILFIFFLLTLVSVNIVFGWFGILTLIINIVLISLAVGGGLMNFWLMLHIIILIYLILYLKDVTFPTVS